MISLLTNRLMLIVLIPAFILAGLVAGMVLGCREALWQFDALWQEASWPHRSGMRNDRL